MKKIIVIGGGPAGYPAALKAASLGAQVTLVEKNKLGGVCLNCGCIPSKSLLDAAHRFGGLQALAVLGNENAPAAANSLFESRDFTKMQARQQAATAKLTQGISFLLKKAGVTVVQGTASFQDEQTVFVQTPQGTQTLNADGVIIAAGTEAFYPPPFDALKGKIYDNSTIFSMPALPRSLAIVGGGVIGCEMADLFSALGVDVHLIELQPRLLPLEDENAVRTLNQAFVKRGIKIHTGVSATAAVQTENSFEITLSSGEKIQTETVLAAIGRSADLTDLHLENIGVAWTRKGVTVNPQTLQVKNNIYAAGDITGLCLLAHAATRQGETAASNLCGVPATYHNERVPRAIYTAPEIAAVGLSRTQAQAQGIAVKAHKTFFLANGRAVAQGQTEGYVEWLSDAQSGKLLGVCLVGAQASELVHVAAVALEAGFTVTQFQQVIFAHPTLAESVWEAAFK